MRLYERMMHTCIRIDHVTADDGEGGCDEAYVQFGAPFMAAIVRDSTADGTVADRSQPSSRWTITTTELLGYHSLLKVLEDGTVFRITSGEGKSTPKASSLMFTQYDAELYQRPEEEPVEN